MYEVTRSPLINQVLTLRDGVKSSVGATNFAGSALGAIGGASQLLSSHRGDTLGMVAGGLKMLAPVPVVGQIAGILGIAVDVFSSIRNKKKVRQAEELAKAKRKFQEKLQERLDEIGIRNHEERNRITRASLNFVLETERKLFAERKENKVKDWSHEDSLRAENKADRKTAYKREKRSENLIDRSINYAHGRDVRGDEERASDRAFRREQDTAARRAASKDFKYLMKRNIIDDAARAENRAYRNERFEKGFEDEADRQRYGRSRDTILDRERAENLKFSRDVEGKEEQNQAKDDQYFRERREQELKQYKKEIKRRALKARREGFDAASRRKFEDFSTEISQKDFENNLNKRRNLENEILKSEFVNFGIDPHSSTANDELKKVKVMLASKNQRRISDIDQMRSLLRMYGGRI